MKNHFKDETNNQDEIFIKLADEQNNAICKFIKIFEALIQTQRFSPENQKISEKYIEKFIELDLFKAETDPNNIKRKNLKFNFTNIINKCDELPDIINEAEKELLEQIEVLRKLNVPRNDGIILPNAQPTNMIDKNVKNIEILGKF